MEVSECGLLTPGVFGFGYYMGGIELGNFRQRSVSHGIIHWVLCFDMRFIPGIHFEIMGHMFVETLFQAFYGKWKKTKIIFYS